MEWLGVDMLGQPHPMDWIEMMGIARSFAFEPVAVPVVAGPALVEPVEAANLFGTE